MEYDVKGVLKYVSNFCGTNCVVKLFSKTFNIYIFYSGC